jgi:hypothetical protein
MRPRNLRRSANGKIALVLLLALGAMLTFAGAAAADTYTTGLESFTLGTVNGQDGWHSAMPGDIPALPNGYDQAIVDTSGFGSPTGFGTKALRLSNAYSEVTGEFFYQTYSPSVPNPAGETQTNHVFDGQFQFISTSANYQPGLNVSISPDNGSGARMSYLALKDTASGIQATFYDVAADGTFRQYVIPGYYSRSTVHTVRFLIQTVPGEANDILRLYIDGVDIGNELGVCFTTWEQYYRVYEHHEPGVIDSFEFRSTNTSGSGYGTCDLNGAVGSPDPVNGPTCTVAGLAGGGYLFDNVTTITRNTDPPAGCGATITNPKITVTGTTCQAYTGNTATSLGNVVYTLKGTAINSVSPGVFFYYGTISGTAGQTVTIKETPNPANVPLIPIQHGQVILYDTSCNVVKGGLVGESDTGGVLTGTLPSTGIFIISVKYSPSDLKGQSLPQPTVTYTIDAAPAVTLAPK